MTAANSSAFDLKDYIMHHVQNAPEWELPFFPAVKLPAFLTLHGLMLVLCAVFLIIIFCFLYRKNQRVPTGLTNVLEMMVVFIRDEIAIPSLGPEDGRRFTPLFCTFFFFILGLNLMGMIPVFSTATANVSVTGALAVITFCFMTIGAVLKNGPAGFFKGLMAPGAPGILQFLLVPLEFLGLFIKTVALTVRLFANMLAGHIVILSLLGLVVLLGAAAIPAILLAALIAVLEVVVAFLQAYIFTLLSAVFIGHTYHPQHGESSLH
jgi:F-type H+-transporting ATPase subunit a